MTKAELKQGFQTGKANKLMLELSDFHYWRTILDAMILPVGRVDLV